MSVAGVGWVIDSLLEEIRPLFSHGADLVTVRQKLVYILEGYANYEGLEATKLAADAFSAALRLIPGPVDNAKLMKALFDLDAKFGHAAVDGVGDPRDWP